jgi:hypothetical protein
VISMTGRRIMFGRLRLEIFF